MPRQGRAIRGRTRLKRSGGSGIGTGCQASAAASEEHTPGAQHAPAEAQHHAERSQQLVRCRRQPGRPGGAGAAAGSCSSSAATALSSDAAAAPRPGRRQLHAELAMAARRAGGCCSSLVAQLPRCRLTPCSWLLPRSRHAPGCSWSATRACVSCPCSAAAMTNRRTSAPRARSPCQPPATHTAAAALGLEPPSTCRWAGEHTQAATACIPTTPARRAACRGVAAPRSLTAHSLPVHAGAGWLPGAAAEAAIAAGQQGQLRHLRADGTAPSR